jgi:hypothetical protein
MGTFSIILGLLTLGLLGKKMQKNEAAQNKDGMSNAAARIGAHVLHREDLSEEDLARLRYQYEKCEEIVLTARSIQELKAWLAQQYRADYGVDLFSNGDVSIDGEVMNGKWRYTPMGTFEYYLPPVHPDDTANNAILPVSEDADFNFEDESEKNAASEKLPSNVIKGPW